MKINLISGLKAASFVALTLIWASCGTEKKANTETMTEEVTETAEEVVEDAHAGHDHDGHDHDGHDHGGEDMDKMDSKGTDLGYAEGSWAWTVQDFMDSGSGTQTFVLDKIPFEGEEISVEGNQQLDDLAELLNSHPELMAEIQGHTPAADNGIGRAAKKTASGARAAWVQLKLKTRGVDGKQLSSKGYADEMLIESLDPKDDGQKRLAIVITK